MHQQLFCFFYIDCFSFFFRCNLKFSVHTRNRCIRCMRCKRDRLFLQNFLCLIRIKRQLHIYLCFFFFQSAKFAVSAKKCSFFSIRNCFLDCLIFFFILKTGEKETETTLKDLGFQYKKEDQAIEKCSSFARFASSRVIPDTFTTLIYTLSQIFFSGYFDT